MKHPAGSNGRSSVCRFWLIRRCRNGNKCRFLHGRNTSKYVWDSMFRDYRNQRVPCSRATPNPAPTRGHPRVCPGYQRGFCWRGPRCKFLHAREILCPNYLAGFCAYGPHCRFNHPKFGNSCILRHHAKKHWSVLREDRSPPKWDNLHKWIRHQRLVGTLLQSSDPPAPYGAYPKNRYHRQRYRPMYH